MFLKGFALVAMWQHVVKYCIAVCRGSAKKLFWSLGGSGGVLWVLGLCCFGASSMGTCGFRLSVLLCCAMLLGEGGIVWTSPVDIW